MESIGRGLPLFGAVQACNKHTGCCRHVILQESKELQALLFHLATGCTSYIMKMIPDPALSLECLSESHPHFHLAHRGSSPFSASRAPYHKSETDGPQVIGPATRATTSELISSIETSHISAFRRKSVGEIVLIDAFEGDRPRELPTGHVTSRSSCEKRPQADFGRHLVGCVPEMSETGQ
jgi:hypothetical protein